MNNRAAINALVVLVVGFNLFSTNLTVKRSQIYWRSSFSLTKIEIEAPDMKDCSISPARISYQLQIIHAKGDLEWIILEAHQLSITKFSEGFLEEKKKSVRPFFGLVNKRKNFQIRLSQGFFRKDRFTRGRNSQPENSYSYILNILNGNISLNTQPLSSGKNIPFVCTFWYGRWDICLQYIAQQW